VEPFIELGVPGSGEAAPPHRGPRRLGVRGARPWPAAVALLLVLSAVTVGSRPMPMLELVASLPAGAMYLNADAENLYVIRADGATTSTLTGYGWRDGDLRWQRTLAGHRNGLSVVAGRPFLLDPPCGGVAGGTVQRLDPATGEVRWTVPGVPTAVVPAPAVVTGDSAFAKLRKVKGDVAVTDGARLLVAYLPDPDCGAAYVPRDDPYPVALSAVDADTGFPQWTVDMRPTERLAIPDRGAAAWFATWDRDGLVRVHDGVTGATTSTAQLATIVPTTLQEAVRVIGDQLVVARQLVNGALLSAYRPDTLELVWRRTLVPVEPVTLGQQAYGPSVESCGPMICVPTPNDVTVLAPATGETLWQRPLVVDVDTGAELLLARDRVDFSHLRAVYWHTGRDALDLAGWHPVSTVVGDPGTGLVERFDGDTARVAAFDLRTGGLRVLGTVTPVPSRCALVGRRLGCIAGNSDTISVWRVPE
jgi:outer membrane protein assembly factor BamB